MARLPRPHIPLEVRCRVALRQLGIIGAVADRAVLGWSRQHSRWLRQHLLPTLAMRLGCEVSQLHLDHDPALENRRQIHSANAAVLSNETIIRYEPDANDPDHLRYIVGGKSGDGSAHDIKTRVRGEHGQHSDHGLARKEKRRQRKLTAKRKTKWPTGRKLQSRNTFRRPK